MTGLDEANSQRSAFSCDILLSLWKLPQHIRLHCNNNNIFWIDIESKEQPDIDSDLGEEIVHFFKRYGVRLYRVNDSCLMFMSTIVERENPWQVLFFCRPACCRHCNMCAEKNI